MLEAALDAARRGLPVLAGWWPVDGGCACYHGSRCRSPGKHPIPRDDWRDAESWLDRASTDERAIGGLWERHPQANVLIAIPPDAVVLDIDPRHGGDDTLAALETRLGALPETWRCLTGGGGAHIYFRGADGVELLSSVPTGIDVQTAGKLVVGPGSLHASGNRYDWAADGHPDDGERAPLPAHWLAALTRPATEDHADDARPETSVPLEERMWRASAQVDTMPGAISGQGGHRQTFAVAVALVRGFVLPREQARELLHAYNLRCKPKWRDRELAHKLDDAEKRSRLPWGYLLDAHARASDGPDDTTGCIPPDAPAAEKSKAVELIQIGEGAELFHDERQDAYAAIKIRDTRRIVRVGRGRDFRDWLRAEYYRSQGRKRAASSEDVASAIGVLSSMARFDSSQRTLHNRFAVDADGSRWLDLADTKQRAVKMTPHGWHVVDRPPILFRRYAHQQPLPTPARGGDIREILDYVRVRRSDRTPERVNGDAALLIGWLGAALIAEIPRASIIFHGSEGSAKTSAGKALCGCVDPSVTDTTTLPRSVPELAQVLDHHAALVIDNVQHLPPAHEDALCRAVTGGAFEKRQLYTDDDDIILTFRRLIVITGIPVPTTAPDLLDRSILVELERVPDAERRPETELWPAYRAARPRILGAILDAVVGAMRIRDTLELGPLPRMADWAAWAAATCEVVGIGASTFLEAYAANRSIRTAEILESQPVAEAVRGLMAEVATWSGTATELLAELNRRRGDRPVPKHWPASERGLTAHLRRLSTTLAAVEIEVTYGRDTDSGRARRITIATGLPSGPSGPSARRRKHSDSAGSTSDGRPEGPGGSEDRPSDPDNPDNRPSGEKPSNGAKVGRSDGPDGSPNDLRDCAEPGVDL